MTGCVMTPFLRMLAFLAVISSCSALIVGHGSGVVVSKSPLATSAQRSCTPVLKRSAEERDVLELEGTVTEAMRGADFRVQIDDINQEIVCRISGKIRKFRIKVLVGDRVTCEVSPYDLTKGRITFRKR
uniref:Translation initiation factor IF-1, chloroplastic n=1 Tax=Haptolina brevifila TaxID=156173 RepID=A0A7S2IMN9_9EUKA|mmetsp:Transcript_67959/g.134718  ORF Transcript_67959/g.134718 Transcript_67959/m.134718 type:complete len:129 (+) Transcript_67959:11-397(+)|eukprot:CAMPEP_0174721148 /NCGR_PEP_ID=MMETSP1094-20130205/35426_1 /TAXON_ID=156173 /ORGANISM="Chrysochromulina brevifilum, Strain UTEX LB 985" /LENGTH=128 /DNA_ID=CAMNT_0015921777 /DNA_START=11 /DNA_END=397 /DNA_ORIENTATION=-